MTQTCVQIVRQICNGKKSVRLDKARTRDFLDAGGTTMNDAEDAAAYLEKRGYPLVPPR